MRKQESIVLSQAWRGEELQFLLELCLLRGCPGVRAPGCTAQAAAMTWGRLPLRRGRQCHGAGALLAYPLVYHDGVLTHTRLKTGEQ